MQKDEPRKVNVIRLNNRSLLAVMSVVILAVIVDSMIGLVADFIPDSLVTNAGIGLFFTMAAVFIAGQYFIFEFIKQKIKVHKTKSRYPYIVNSAVKIALYVLAGIFALIIAQMIATSQYNSTLLIASTSISYGLFIVMFGLLAKGFLSWHRFSSKKNAMILVFAAAMTSTVVYSAGALLLSFGMLQEQPQVITSQYVAFFPAFEPNTFYGMVQIWYQVAAGVMVILTWIGIVMLLYPYAQKFGKIKFWVVMGIAIFSHTIQIPLFMFGWYSPAENSDAMTNILTITLIGIYTGIIFGAAFLSVARAVPKGSFLRDHMIIAAYGYLLLLVVGTATASQAAYPPFGLASVSFVGLASYMIYTGLYTSAISVSEDATLRISIKKSAKEQTKLLDSIGSAEMKKELQNRVLKITKEHSDSMVEETGVEPSMTEEEIKNYLDAVIKESRTEA